MFLEGSLSRTRVYITQPPSIEDSENLFGVIFCTWWWGYTFERLLFGHRGVMSKYWTELVGPRGPGLLMLRKKERKKKYIYIYIYILH